jgi:hypothetical protein
VSPPCRHRRPRGRAPRPCIGPGAVAWHVEGLATAASRPSALPALVLARRHGVSRASRDRSLAADLATGIGPGAAARRIEGRGTSPASRGAGNASPGLMLAPLATVPAVKGVPASPRGPWCGESGLTKEPYGW